MRRLGRDGTWRVLRCGKWKRPAEVAGALALCCVVGPRPGFASDLDTIGITELRAIRPDLTGSGVSVAQIEATAYNNPNDPNGTAPYDPQYDADNFEVNPADEFSGTSNPVITYVNKAGTATTTFNAAQDSSHGDIVASHFYATTTGAAPGVTAVVNYNVNYFFDNVIQNLQPIQMPLAPSGAAGEDRESEFCVRQSKRKRYDGDQSIVR